MADKGNTLFNGSSVITASPRVPVRTVAHPSASTRGRIWTVVLVVAISVVTAVGLVMIPQDWTWEALRVLSVGLVLLAAFYFPVENPKPSYVIWFVMLVGECLFFREGDSNSSVNAYAGLFPTAAYGQAIGWTLCFLATLACSRRLRRFTHRLFEGDFKWITLFTVLCFFSSFYTPRPALGFVWAFKMIIVTLLLLACSDRMRDLRQIALFLSFTFFAYAIIVLQPVIIAMMRGEMFDEEGRMSTIVSPNALSPNAAILLLIAMTLFSRRKGEGLYKSAAFFALVGCAVMILAGSKTGILAAIVAGGLYFIVRGRLGSAFTFIIVTGVLVAILALTTPLGDYLHLYRDRQGAESFSGRTLLWKAAVPAIKAKPILGHGYMSTEFLVFEINGVGWAAPHLHNGFLEAVYNTGSIGFLITMITILVIPWNLYRVLRRSPNTSAIHRIASGCIGIWAFLLINGFFNSSFGGKLTPPFMVLLALLVVSSKLRNLVSDSSLNGGSQLVWRRPL